MLLSRISTIFIEFKRFCERQREGGKTPLHPLTASRVLMEFLAERRAVGDDSLTIVISRTETTSPVCVFVKDNMCVKTHHTHTPWTKHQV